MTDKFVPTHADAARFLGVKVATIRHATPGVQITGKNNRVATFYGQHPPNINEFLGNTWWHIREHEVDQMTDMNPETADLHEATRSMLQLTQQARPELEGEELGLLTMRALALIHFDLNLGADDQADAFALLPKYAPLASAVKTVMFEEGIS